jgi:peroxiredoxin
MIRCFLFFLLLILPSAFSESTTKSPESTRTGGQTSTGSGISFEKDARNQLKKFDFSIPLKVFTHRNNSLMEYKNGNLLIFYFSARCEHCQKAVPHVLKLVRDLGDDSLKMIAIASGSNKDKDIARFMAKYKVDVPLFHDKRRAFSRKYGTGSVPIIYLVNKKGNYLRFKKFNQQTSPDLIKKVYENKKNF